MTSLRTGHYLVESAAAALLAELITFAPISIYFENSYNILQYKYSQFTNYSLIHTKLRPAAGTSEQLLRRRPLFFTVRGSTEKNLSSLWR